MIVRLNLSSSPDSAALVRGVLAGLAELLSVDPELLDNMKLAVSEACNNAVEHAYGGEAGSLAVAIALRGGGLEVSVRDWGSGFHRISAMSDHLHVGLPLINALADRAEFISPPDGGTEVRMSFSIGGRGMSAAGSEVEVDDQALERWLSELPGDVVVMLSPVDSVSVIVARLAQALANRGRFPIEHASDIQDFVEVLAGQTSRAAIKPWIAASLRAGETDAGFAIGPLRPGFGRELQLRSMPGADAPPRLSLADRLLVKQIEDAELVRFGFDAGAGTAR